MATAIPQTSPTPRSLVPAAGTLHDKRLELTAAEKLHERQRQATQLEKRYEKDRLDREGEDHRRKVDDVLASRKRILGEMRNVRDKMHEKFASTKAQGHINVGIANRELARAGQRALDARTESELWQAHAAKTHSLASARGARERQSLAQVQEGHDSRVADAEAHSELRKDRGQQMVDETLDKHDQLFQRHHEDCDTQERHQTEAARLRNRMASLAQEDSLMQVKTAIEKSKRSHMQTIKDIKQSRDDAFEKVSAAQQDLADKKRECEAMLEREHVCNLQAKHISDSLKAQQEQDREWERTKMEKKLHMVAEKAQGYATSFDAEHEVGKQRNKAWKAASSSAVQSARERQGDEQHKAQERVNLAKRQLANLQAECAAHISSLLEQFEEAKRVQKAKVDAAARRTEELSQRCNQILADFQVYCRDFLDRTAAHEDNKQKFLEDNLSQIESHSKHRVAMTGGHSLERLKQAERQLDDMKRHVEECRVRAEDRVRQENLAAEEKVRSTKKRCQEQVERAERRFKEADEKRDVARAAFEAVVSRTHGACEEARRQGLCHIAEVIAPPVLDGAAAAALGRRRSEPPPLGTVMEDTRLPVEEVEADAGLPDPVKGAGLAGTWERPQTGSTRPFTGSTARPFTSSTTRPFTGSTARPVTTGTGSMSMSMTGYGQGSRGLTTAGVMGTEL